MKPQKILLKIIVIYIFSVWDSNRTRLETIKARYPGCAYCLSNVGERLRHCSFSCCLNDYLYSTILSQMFHLYFFTEVRQCQGSWRRQIKKESLEFCPDVWTFLSTFSERLCSFVLLPKWYFLRHKFIRTFCLFSVEVRHYWVRWEMKKE